MMRNQAALPDPPHPCLGRERELAELVALLEGPAPRLVTLVGPGGIGKTRLALAAAGAARHAFRDGAVFVDLQAVRSADTLATSIAAALGLVLTGASAADFQLLNALRSAELLLLLDNAEQLQEGVELIASMLQASPGLAILVTSRQLLRLREEWVYPVEGLAVPPEDAEAIETYAAVQLFEARARQVQPGFDLEREREAVRRICCLVEGMPLAIELAAAWTTTLSCATIADEIAHNLDFLASTLRNIPPRHRSVRAAFDHCWPLLNDEQQQLFARLSVFRGGFTYTAAHQVAGATLNTLLALTERALLRRTADDRFQIHALLRQYGEQQLQTLPEGAVVAQAAHRSYYLTLLASSLSGLLGGDQAAATTQVADEFENLQAAWQHAVGQRDLSSLARGAAALGLFYQYRGPYQEGIVAFNAAVGVARQRGAEGQEVLARLLIDLAWLQLKRGQFREARHALDESAQLHERLGLAPAAGRGTDPRLGLGVLALVDGEYDRAAQLAQAALAAAQQRPQPWNEAVAWWVLAGATRAQGALDDAERAIRRAYALAHANGDQWFVAYCRNELGKVALNRGAIAEAAQHFAISYELRAAMRDPEGMALALTLLAHARLKQGEGQAAREEFERSIGWYRQIGDQGGLALALDGLGRAALLNGQTEAAERWLTEGLELAVELRFTPLILTILVSVATWLRDVGWPTLARQLCELAHNHALSDWETRVRAGQAATALDTAKRAEREDSTSRSLPSVLAALLLKVQPALEGTAPWPLALGETQTPAEKAQQRLPEPLTERELQILRLIAQGQSNREIATQLLLSEGTVRWYTSQLYGKLAVNTRTQAVVRAKALYLIP